MYRSTSNRISANITNKVKSDNSKFADWILSHVPTPIKKKTDDRVEKLKEQINNIYKKLNNKETDIQLKKTALKGYMT